MTPNLSRKNDANGTVPAETPRLRLKPKAPPRGRVDGAWWPHTADLVGELPDLLAVLSVRLGPIARVLYNSNGWTEAPRKLTTGGRVVRLDGYQLQPADTVEILGMNGTRAILLLIAPDEQPQSAHDQMMAAAEPAGAVAHPTADASEAPLLAGTAS